MSAMQQAMLKAGLIDKEEFERVEKHLRWKDTVERKNAKAKRELEEFGKLKASDILLLSVPNTDPKSS